MFNIKIISILSIVGFLFVGCDDPTKPKESNYTTNESTLSDSDLGHEIGNIQDYFYDFNKDISSTFLFYSNKSKIINPSSSMDPLKDTLNSRQIDYEVDEGGGAFYGPKIDIHIRDAIGR